MAYKYNVGDKIKIVCDDNSASYNGMEGVITGYTNDDEYQYNVRLNSCAREVGDHEIELVSKGTGYMGRRTFRLTKETADLKKGAILQEKCDDGDQDYTVLDESFIKYENEEGRKVVEYPRGAVEKEPKWFEEVLPLTEAWGTKEELKAFKEFQKAQKAKK